MLADFPAELDGLAEQGLEAARRATRLPVTDLCWQWRDDSLTLTFSLPAGAFATTVLAELLHAEEGRAHQRI